MVQRRLPARRTRLSKLSRKRGGYIPGKMMTAGNWSWHVWTDSYKLSHTKMYSPNSTKLVAYGEPRGPLTVLKRRITTNKWGEDTKDEKTSFLGAPGIVVCGIDYIIEKYINKPSSKTGFESVQNFFTHHYNGGQFPYDEELFKLYSEKKPPIKIFALAEGTVVLPHTPMYQIVAEGTAKRADGISVSLTPLVTFFETILTMVWYPSCIATICQYVKTLLSAANKDHTVLYFDYGQCTSEEQADIAKHAISLIFEKHNEGPPKGESIDFDLSTFENNLKQNKPFTVGTGLFQIVNRDTINFATKLNYAEETTSKRVVMKAPLGEPGKRSLPGQLVVLSKEYQVNGNTCMIPKVFTKPINGMGSEIIDFNTDRTLSSIKNTATDLLRFVYDGTDFKGGAPQTPEQINTSWKNIIDAKGSAESGLAINDDNIFDGRSEAIKVVQKIMACKNHDRFTDDTDKRIVKYKTPIIPSAQTTHFKIDIKTLIDKWVTDEETTAALAADKDKFDRPAMDSLASRVGADSSPPFTLYNQLAPLVGFTEYSMGGGRKKHPTVRRVAAKPKAKPQAKPQAKTPTAAPEPPSTFMTWVQKALSGR